MGFRGWLQGCDYKVVWWFGLCCLFDYVLRGLVSSVLKFYMGIYSLSMALYFFVNRDPALRIGRV